MARRYFVEGFSKHQVHIRFLKGLSLVHSSSLEPGVDRWVGSEGVNTNSPFPSDPGSSILLIGFSTLLFQEGC
jgi:hypothetical protein